MIPLYALHKDRMGRIVATGNFTDSDMLNDWLRARDVRAGDRIEFGECLARDEVVAAPESVAA